MIYTLDSYILLHTFVFLYEAVSAAYAVDAKPDQKQAYEKSMIETGTEMRRFTQYLFLEKTGFTSKIDYPSYQTNVQTEIYEKRYFSRDETVMMLLIRNCPELPLSFLSCLYPGK